jgi:hypothetical protein
MGSRAHASRMGDNVTKTHDVLRISIGALVLAIASCGDDDDAASDTIAAREVVTTSGATASTEPPAPTIGASETQATTAAPEAPAGTIDACSLLTSEEAAAALGGPVDPPQSGMTGPFSECIWRIEGGTEIDSAVVVQALGGVSADQFEQYVEENTPPELGPVSTVEAGDKAYEQIALMVRSGDAMVVVTVLSGDPDGGQSKQLGLAQAAIDRLP